MYINDDIYYNFVFFSRHKVFDENTCPDFVLTLPFYKA